MVIAQSTLNSSPPEDLFSWSDFFMNADKILSPISSLVTILTAACAIYIYFKNRDKVSLLFSVLKNFGNQVSLTELTLQMNKLSDLYISAGDRDQILHILAEIEGQLSTNDDLLKDSDQFIKKLRPFISEKKEISEADKRYIVASLREHIRMSYIKINSNK